MPQKVIKNLSERAEKSIEVLKTYMQGIRTGRAHPALIDDIKVDYYGTPTAIKNLGNVTVPEARCLVVTPWDASAIPEIEKAILASPLGITPQNDGQCIRLNLPELTQQRRVELKKMVSKEAENTRISIRNIRRDANDAIKKLEKDSTITEDISKKSQKEAQEKTDFYIKKIDAILAEKEKEIMEN